MTQNCASTRIAIIGLSCRFPKAETPLELWDLLSERRSAWSTIPTTRFNANSFQNPDVDSSGTFNCMGAHFLESNVRAFDASFFAIHPAEAHALDPQQRLQLECAFEAIENAGISVEIISGSKTGVYISTFNQDYDRMLMRDPDNLPTYHMIGNGDALLSNRISHFFDLHGPSMTLDTGCSGGLVALHQACQSLRTGEAEQAIVGGANLMLSPEIMVSMSAIRFFSQEGRSYSYDSRANGYGRGEGVAAVLLKPLDKALADNDPIRAIICSTATNQDGWTPGITLPNGKAQVSLIRHAYELAGLDPLKTAYCEAHGTGTAAGDPIEASSIHEALSQERPESSPLYVGSVKTNVGHLESVSGLAGLIKTVLMLERGRIAPNFDFQYANPKIPLHEWKMVVPTRELDWPQCGVRQASINSFGYGGTNAHVVLQAFDSLQSQTTNGHIVGDRTQPWPFIFNFSAKTLKTCLRQTAAISRYLSLEENQVDQRLVQLAYTLNTRRSFFSWRKAVVAHDVSELLARLTEQGEVFKAASRVKIAFVFTGQGSQWYAMGRELLLSEPVFQASMERASMHLQNLGVPWDLHVELLKSAKTSQVKLANFAQPLVTALQLGITDVLTARNIRPSKVVGHSSGEIAAAYACGALDFESALSVAWYRGLCASQLKVRHPKVRGLMLAVAACEADITTLLDNIPPHLGRAVVACENSAKSLTVSGDVGAVEYLQEQLHERNIWNRRLDVDTAYHSHHMQLVAEEYRSTLDRLPNCAPNNAVEFFSAVTGSQLSPVHLDADYWIRNMVSRVCFLDALRSLCTSFSALDETELVVMLEIGPHHTLAGPVKSILASLPSQNFRVEYVHSLKRDMDAVLAMHSLYCKLWSIGASDSPRLIDSSKRKTRKPSVLTDLPSYPWDHSTDYWLEPRISRDYRNRPFPKHALLGAMSYEFDSTVPRWRNVLRANNMSWMIHHTVLSSPIFPAAAYLSMIVEAVKQHVHLTSDHNTSILNIIFQDVRFENALALGETSLDSTEIDTSLIVIEQPGSRKLTTRYNFRIRSLKREGIWVQNCSGCVNLEIGRDDTGHCSPTRPHLSHPDEQIVARLSTEMVYGEFAKRQLNYSGPFQSIRKVLRYSGHVTTEIEIPFEAGVLEHSSVTVLRSMYMLEACLQSTVVAALTPENEGMAMVLTYIGQLNLLTSTDIGLANAVRAYSTHEELGQSDANMTLTVDSESTDGSRTVMLMGSNIFMTQIPIPKDENRDKNVRAFSLQRVLDVTRLESDEILTICQSVLPSPERDPHLIFAELDAVSLHFARLAMQKLGEMFKTPANYPHLQHFYNWLVGYIEENKGDGRAALRLREAGNIDNLLSRVENQSRTGEMLCRMGKHLASILNATEQPLPLMLKDDLLAQFYNSESLNRCYLQMKTYLELLAQQNPTMKVLEIGAGTGGTTLSVLEGLSHQVQAGNFLFQSYDFTDISSGFFEKAQQRLGRWISKLDFRRLDIEMPTSDQGFQAGTYDLVVASNVLHATTSIDRTLQHVRQLLRPGGTLILLEITTLQSYLNVAFGGLSGWWAGVDDGRVSSPLMTSREWDTALRRNGFSSLHTTLPDYNGEVATTEVLISMAIPIDTDQKSQNLDSHCIIIDTASKHSSALIQTVKTVLKNERWEVHNCIPHSKNTSLNTSAIIEINVRAGFSTEEINRLDQTLGIFDRVCVIMEQSTTQDEQQINRLDARRGTQPSRRLISLSLDPSSDVASQSKALASLLRDTYTGACVDDVDYIEQNGKIFLPRYLPVEISETAEKLVYKPFSDRCEVKLELRRPNAKDTVFRSSTTTSIAADELRLMPLLTGIAYEDVICDASFSHRPRSSLRECIGVVVEVGQLFKNDFKVGDMIMSVTLDSIRNYLRVKAAAAIKVDTRLPLDSLISIPLALVTAAQCLRVVGRAMCGESVLVLSAQTHVAGAILWLARASGLRTYAVVDNENERTALCERQGISEHRIFVSTDRYCSTIMRETANRGVDMVISRVFDEQVELSLQCAAMFARVICWSSNSMFRAATTDSPLPGQQLLYATVDMISVLNAKPRIFHDQCQALLSTLKAQDLTQKLFPQDVFPIAELSVAKQRLLGLGPHSKVFLATHEDVQISCRIQSHHRPTQLDGNKGVLVVCDNDHLNQSISTWLSEKQLKAIFCDFKDSDELERVMKAHHIAGVIHSQATPAPTSLQILDETLKDSMLDFFISILPYSVGGSEAHENIFEPKYDLRTEIDRIARQDCSVIGIELLPLPYPDPMSSATKNELHCRLAPESLSFAARLSMLSETSRIIVIDTNHPGAIFDLAEAKQKPVLLHTYYWPTKSSQEVTATRGIQESRLSSSMEPSAAKEIMYDALIAKLSKLLAIPAEDFSANNTIAQLGVDSLVAAELQSWTSKTFKASIDTSEIMGSSSLGALTDQMVRRSELLASSEPVLPAKDILPSNITQKSSTKKKRTLAYQDSLPRMPVPSLEDSLRKYTNSIRFWQNEDEFALSKRHIESFQDAGGMGPVLQRRLIERSQDPEIKNWLYDYWVDNYYLKPRKPITPTTNFFMAHSHTPKAFSMAKRAAVLTKSVMEYMNAYENGTLEPHMLHGSPIDMAAYYWLFNSCRVPRLGQDESMKFTALRHVAVVYNERFWKLDLSTIEYLETQVLETAYEQVMDNTLGIGPGMGVLTAQDRDIWADDREYLRALHPSNEISLEIIESAAFVVCLDDKIPASPEDKARQFWYGKGRDRWSDKPLQFIVTPSCSGFCGEHSRLDGSPVIRLNRHVNDALRYFKGEKDEASASRMHQLNGLNESKKALAEVTQLDFHLDSSMSQRIATAQNTFADAVAQCQLRILDFVDFGEDFLRGTKGMNPSACLQMVFQLASYQYFDNKAMPSFEPVGNFRFQQGRYDAVRTVSDESLTFCHKMLDTTCPNAERLRSLREAIAKHVQQIHSISYGGSGDNHLFGLYMSLHAEETPPAIFVDPVFRLSTDWFLSTSFMPADDMLYGFGPDLDHGWSIQYPILPERVLMCVTTRKGNLDRMCKLLSSSVEAVRALLLSH